ncbi:MAG: LacI family transcriptional regulator [Erysipelotrichaceae bacterium]|nr:MAG: LacI family transcriptional [Erysipelotrichaceae bacterium]TXT19333.1 MAG: LacI family transcriptional regulator [Erysipelotrichaceae bacterium]
MATIIDVAKKAGVGIATVSRVINHSGYVKKETREKVEQVISEIGFVSNEIAKSMALQKNNLVAFLLPNSTHLFFGELLNSVEKELYQRGYMLMLCNSSERIEKEIIYVEMLKKSRVDGLIMLTNNNIEPFIEKQFPIVSFDRRFEDVPCVSSDNYQGGVMAARYLLDNGCHKFMFIGDDAQGEHTSVNTEVSKRRKGFIEELRRQGIHHVINIEYPLGDYNYIPETVYQSVIDHPEVDGIFANNDNIAAEVVKHLEDQGRKVPKDVKVIGFDGGRGGYRLNKTITSISQDPDAIAIALVESVVSRINGNKVNDKIIPVNFATGETA